MSGLRRIDSGGRDVTEMPGLWDEGDTFKPPVGGNYTPGPWQVDRVNSEYLHDVTIEYNIPGEGSPILIAMCFHDEEKGGRGRPITARQATANARLMSAAPDLLEALQAVVRIADRKTVEFDLARAAIAKATGKTP